jgi:hypothetical protein
MSSAASRATFCAPGLLGVLLDEGERTEAVLEVPEGVGA